LGGSAAERRSRVLSGIQPTGELHIGNYLGAVRNWVRLQDEYECFYPIVDYHAIASPFDPRELRKLTEDMLVSLVAAGLDPNKCHIFIQSEVPEHTELAWVLTSLAPLGQLQRMTQFKDKTAGGGESVNAGLLMYPVLQSADILLYKADRVPVGEDQSQHLVEDEGKPHRNPRPAREDSGADGDRVHRPSAQASGRPRPARGV
jgi:tryptophanyl-tRNA synthetase